MAKSVSLKSGRNFSSYEVWHWTEAFREPSVSSPQPMAAISSSYLHCPVQATTKSGAFYRLVQQAVIVDPVPYKSMVRCSAVNAEPDHNL